MDKGNSEEKKHPFWKYPVKNHYCVVFEAFVHFLLHIYLCIQFCYSMHQNKMQVYSDADFICIGWHLFCPFVCLCSFPLLYFFLLLVVFFFFPLLCSFCFSLWLSVPTVLSPFANFLCLCLSVSFSWSGPMRGMTDQWSLNKTKDNSKPDSFLGPFYFFTFCAMNTFNCKLSSRSPYFLSSCFESK